MVQSLVKLLDQAAKLAGQVRANRSKRGILSTADDPADALQLIHTAVGTAGGIAVCVKMIIAAAEASESAVSAAAAALQMYGDDHFDDAGAERRRAKRCAVASSAAASAMSLLSRLCCGSDNKAVSYTHLTLPTILLV